MHLRPSPLTLLLFTLLFTLLISLATSHTVETDATTDADANADLNNNPAILSAASDYIHATSAIASIFSSLTENGAAEITDISSFASSVYAAATSAVGSIFTEGTLNVESVVSEAGSVWGYCYCCVYGSTYYCCDYFDKIYCAFDNSIDDDADGNWQYRTDQRI
ncbi:hypothetical protein E4T47_08774 [Aureobasidium subglaciale]|nr:hypothetical protein E4T47_08774 [Aureobasidium subglaciale]